MKGKALLRKLRSAEKPTPAPLYYFFGDDSTVIDELMAFLKEQVSGPLEAFNLDQLNGAESSGQQICSSAQQMPMMAPQRVVLVRHADQLKAAEWEPLLPYLEDPSPACCLAFASAKKPDGKTRAAKRLKKAKALVECSMPRRHELPSWARDRAREVGTDLSREAAEKLVELVGAEPGVLDTSLQKLLAYVGERKKISADDVEEVVASTREQNIFELTDAVADRNLDRSLAVLKSALEDRRQPLQMLALLAATFRKFTAARAAMDCGESPREVADRHVHPRLRHNRRRHIDTFLSRVKRFSAHDLDRITAGLHRAEVTLKSSWVPGELVLQQLIVELIRSRKRPR